MILISMVLILLLMLIDLGTKYAARTYLKNDVVDKDVVKFAIVRNYGSFKGLFRNNRKLLLTFQTTGVVVVFGYLLNALVLKKSKLLTLGLTLLLGGALGNFIDRIKNGYVTDFFAVKWTKNLYYNLADMFIFLGGILAVIGEMLEQKS